MTQKALFVGMILVFSLTCIIGKTQDNTSSDVFLTPKEQSITLIAASAAIGDLTKLKKQLKAGLEAGLTVNQIRELLVHLYAYAGFPRSLRGLISFMEVLAERKNMGIQDVAGPEASPVNSDSSRYDRGKQILQKLTGVKEPNPKTGYAAFAPEIEVFLKEHLFADLFERDVLTYIERELVTISVLSSIGGVQPMLKSHMNICLNLGLKPAQLKQFIYTVKPVIGKRKTIDARKILEEVLDSKR